MTAILHAMTSYVPRGRHAVGLLVVLIGSLFCLWLNTQLNIWSNGKIVGLSSLTLAILVGMVIGNTIYPKFATNLGEGVSFAKGQILRLAIMLYGFKLTLAQVAGVGLPAVMSDALVLSSTFLLTYFLGTRWLKVDKQTALLIGSGASICGAAAVIATEPVVKAEAHKVTIAVATVVVFGTMAMLLYPFLYHLGWLNAWLGAQNYGVYTGSTIHEVAQVVVAGNAISADVGNTAVVTKMIRVMMLAPFLLILSFALTAKTKSNAPSTSFWDRARKVNVPWFAFIFIGLVVVHSWLPMSAQAEQLMITLDDVLLTMAMFALGLTTHISAIKQAGAKPLWLGAIAFGWLILGGGLINGFISLF